MGLRFNPRLIPRFDQSLLPFLNENFQQLARLLGQVPSETISTVPPENPYLGQSWYDSGTNQIKYWNGSSWQPGDWINYTPAISQGVLLAKTVATESAYQRSGKTITFQTHLNITSAGTAGQPFNISLPVSNVAAGNRYIGGGFYYNGAINILLAIYCTSATGIQLISVVTGGDLGAGTTAAAGHAVTLSMVYEATT